MATPLSAEDLAAKYPDDSTRERLFRLLDIGQLLKSCIIRSDYRVGLKLYDPISLTVEGNRLIEALRKKGVAYPEARMYCLLELFHTDIFVDPDQTDIDRLVEKISAEIRDGTIMHPYIYGRLLYDKSLSLGHREDDHVLGERETQELLEYTPQGVFQFGDYVTGPYGILKSASKRFVSSALRIAFHCDDINCRAVHYRWLTTSEDAPINAHRAKLRKQLERQSKYASEWRDFLEMYSGKKESPYNDLAADPVVPLLGDALDLSEIRSLVEWLLDNTQEHVRQVAGSVGLSGKAKEVVEKLDQAELLQLALVSSNRQLFNALDVLVSRDIIEIPEGEIRRPVLSERGGSGWYGLSAELGKYGIRLQSHRADVAPLRLRRLVGQMYRLDEQGDRHELEWQLRGEHADTLEARLEQYLQNNRPREIVSSLLLARRSNMVVAIEKLDLSEQTLGSDEERINAVLWKLGFSVEDAFDRHRDFWSLSSRMAQLTRQSAVNPLAADPEEIRGTAANYFVALEDLLRDSLLYTTWALTTDHQQSSRPYTYQPKVHEPAAMTVLQEWARHNTGDGDVRINYDDRPTLYPLMRGFGLLADVLESFESRIDDYRRKEAALPKWVSLQDLQDFPFKHTIPFLDLLNDSRRQIRKSLKEVSRRLTGADINDARNEWMHARRGSLDVERLRQSLDSVRDAIVLIQDSGFSRHVYRRVRSELDEARRETIILSDGRNQEVALFRPSHLQWLGLPSLRKPQHVMSSARFYEPTEVLRFLSEADSAYTRLWSNYPMRSARSGRAMSRTHLGAESSS